MTELKHLIKNKKRMEKEFLKILNDNFEKNDTCLGILGLPITKDLVGKMYVNFAGIRILKQRAERIREKNGSTNKNKNRKKTSIAKSNY